MLRLCVLHSYGARMCMNGILEFTQCDDANSAGQRCNRAHRNIGDNSFCSGPTRE